MPTFLDRHDVVEFSAEQVAKLHVKDLEVQGKYGVKFLTYWYDAERRTTFCLVDAPDKETADKVHAEAHGHVANAMVAVDEAEALALEGLYLALHLAAVADRHPDRVDAGQRQFRTMRPFQTAARRSSLLTTRSRLAIR